MLLATPCLMLAVVFVLTVFFTVAPRIAFFYDLDGVDDDSADTDIVSNVFNLQHHNQQFSFIRNLFSLYKPNTWRWNNKRPIYDNDLGTDRHVRTFGEAMLQLLSDRAK